MKPFAGLLEHIASISFFLKIDRATKHCLRLNKLKKWRNEVEAMRVAHNNVSSVTLNNTCQPKWSINTQSTTIPEASRSFPKVYVRTRATYTQQTSTQQGSGAYIILETHDRPPTENHTRYLSCHYTGVYIGAFHTLLSAVSQEVTGPFRRKDESLRTTRYCIDSINPRFKLFTHRYEILFLHLNA